MYIRNNIFTRLFNFFKKILSSKLASQLLLIFIGFGLTTLVGNYVASRYQERLWRYQNKAAQHESETKAASRIFEETSRLIDKRIYRMQQLNWWLEENKDQKRIRQQMNLYQDVLYEWNDNRNRNIALMERYFGKSVSDYYDKDLHSAIKDTGKMLENYYYLPSSERKVEMGWEIDGRMGDLENKARQIDVTMLKMIQQQKVGIFNPEVGSADSPLNR